MIQTATRDEILAGVARYHTAAFPQQTFVPGETPVPCAGRAFDADELVHWWTPPWISG
jgi:CDP-6-deoxy-D-xylo-4-hexulose-3-dehydrase